MELVCVGGNDVPPPHKYRRVKSGSYEVLVFGVVVGRVAKIAPNWWAAYSVEGVRAGPDVNHVRRDSARYALVMSPEGRAVWQSATLPKIDLDEVGRGE